MAAVLENSAAFRRGSCPPGHAHAGMRSISLANLRSVTWRGTALLALGHLGAALPGAAAPAHAASRAFAVAPRSAREFAARSVDGRALRAIHIGPSRGPAILVVGAIHGNEPAGIAVARDLLADSNRARASLWVISDLNPDGVARGTRQNAHGVDLNRNFPWRWHLAGRVGDFQYSGPTVLSEPESRFAFALIRRVQPAITIWFHQPLGVVDASGGSLRVERRFANRVGLPLQELSRYRGSAATWQNHYFHTSTAFVVELPAGALTDAKVEQFAHAVETAAG
jgi:protein MpaA